MSIIDSYGISLSDRLILAFLFRWKSYEETEWKWSDLCVGNSVHAYERHENSLIDVQTEFYGSFLWDLMDLDWFPFSSLPWWCVKGSWSGTDKFGFHVIRLKVIEIAATGKQYLNAFFDENSSVFNVGAFAEERVIRWVFSWLLSKPQ